jgi:MFS family permease
MKQHAEELEKKEVPLVSVLKRHWQGVLLGAFGTMSCFALQGLLASYALTLGTSQGGHSRTAVLVAFAVGSLLQVAGIAFYARQSDRYGRRPVMMFGLCWVLS